MQTEKPAYDYTDSFTYVIGDPADKLGIVEIAEVFSQPGPKWIERLLALRDKLVAPFGLKTSDSAPESTLSDDKWQPGAQAGIFRVFDRTADTILLGEDDKHLDFRVLLSIERIQDEASKKKITVSTLVKRHNWLGKIYFFFVKPAHRLIVPAMMKQKFRQLESEINS